MGIHDLNKFLRSQCPSIFEEIHISEYSYKKVAIDTSLYMCKFKVLYGDEWLSAFLNLVACLRKQNVHCVFIYDSGSPYEKAEERQKRACQRVKNQEKVSELENAVKMYHETKEIQPLLIDFYNKRTKTNKPLLLLTNSTTQQINMVFVEQEVAKMRSYILNISPEDYEMTKKLFEIIKVPYYNAPLEAETMCSDLCKRGLVDGVLSEDTDVLAYASNMFITKINTYNGTAIRIDYDDMLKELEFTSDQFLDFCIMCGTDYNKNIFNIGPKKAYLLLKKYESIEGISENTDLDVSVLNHVRVRELFREYEQFDIDKIPYCGIPNLKKLFKFIVNHNIKCSETNIVNSFTQTVILDD